MKKILMILSNEFITDVRVYREAKALVDAGYEVTVIVWDRKSQYKSEEVIDGVKLIRIHNNFLMKILPNDLLRNPFWWGRAYRKGLELYINSYKFDVVHCHDLDTLKVGVKLKKKTGCKLVYDAHEIFGYMIERDVPKFVVNYVFRMEKKLVQHVDHLITVTEPIVSKYFEKITNAPITIVMNCKDIVIKEYALPKNKVFTVSFISTLHRRRMFPEIIDTIGKIPNIKFVLAAKKENMDLYREVEQTVKKYDNIEFLGQIPFNEVIPKTLEASVIIDPIDPDSRTTKIGLASKILDAMSCGRPIICTKGTYSAEIVNELKCGLAVDFSVDAFRDAIIKLRDDPTLCEKLGRIGLNVSLTKYNWDIEKDKFLKVYKELINEVDKN